MQAQPLQNVPAQRPTTSSINEKPPLDSSLLAFARKLRQQHSDPGRLLWALLRNRHFGNFKFRRQHPFKPFILDFYCQEAKLAIELDGGQHNTDSARQYDSERTAFLESHEISV